MCGRFASFLPAEAMARVCATLGEVPDRAPSWNVAPGQAALVVRIHPRSGERRLDALRWGLIPHFETDPKGGRRPINARAESIARAPMFRGAFRDRRCLVPMDAFYEWHDVAGRRQPRAFARADAAPLALAGVWEGWRAPDGTVHRSFAIATIAANDAMRPFHDRMPVVLDPADWPVWLGEAEGDPARLLRPAPDDALRSWPVGRSVNTPRNDGPALLERVDEPEGERAAETQAVRAPALVPGRDDP